MPIVIYNLCPSQVLKQMEALRLDGIIQPALITSVHRKFSNSRHTETGWYKYLETVQITTSTYILLYYYYCVKVVSFQWMTTTYVCRKFPNSRHTETRWYKSLETVHVTTSTSILLYSKGEKLYHSNGLLTTSVRCKFSNS